MSEIRSLQRRGRDTHLTAEFMPRGRNTGPEIHSPESNTNTSFRFYFKVLFKYKWLILTCVALTLLVVGFGLAKVRPTYEAATVIQIDPEKADVLDRNKAMFYQTWLDPEYYNTQLKLLTNPSLARQVVFKLDLRHDPNFIVDDPTTLSAALAQIVRPSGRPSPPPRKEAPKTIPDSTLTELSPEVDEEIEGLAGRLIGGLTVAPVTKTRLVRISYQHQDPDLARKVVNTLAETFIQNNLKKRVGSSQNTSDFLRQRMAELQNDIHMAEEKLIDYGKAHSILSLDEKQNTVVERMATLNRQLLEAEADRKQIESVYTLTKSGVSPDTITEVQTNSTIQDLSGRLSQLTQKRAELLTRYTDEWPELKEVERQITQVKTDLQNEKSKIVAGIETRYRAAVERERLLRADFEKERGNTLKQNEDAINFRLQQEEINTKKELFKTILAQLKEADIASSSDINNISMTTPALSPKAPISPRIPFTMSIAFCLSMAGGVGLAFLREYLNTRIHSVEDVDRFVNLPTLGLIPAFDPNTIDQPREPRQLNGGGGLLLPEHVDDEEFSGASAMTAFYAPESTVAEAYRHLRTNVLLMPIEAPCKIILVTSGQPEEGKTTTAVNLAVALSHTGARTVLIDGDLRKPSVHRFFGHPEGKADLGRYLSGYSPMEDLFSKPILPNLNVISSSGPRPLYPAELLGSTRMKELIQYLSDTRDYVIIDTPPILPFADALILTAEVDGVILVVNSEKSHREVVQRADRILAEVGAVVLGVVLNNVQPQHTNYGYYYNYKYKYYSPDSDDKNLFNRVVGALRDLNGKSGDRRRQHHKNEGVGRNLKIEVEPTVDEKPDASAHGAPKTANGNRLGFQVKIVPPPNKPDGPPEKDK